MSSYLYVTTSQSFSMFHETRKMVIYAWREQHREKSLAEVRRGSDVQIDPLT